MEYDAEVYLLSIKFYDSYSQDKYPELMRKKDRPYTCLLVDTHCGYFICIPFRSHIQHENAYMFANSVRSRRTKSGLDYSKIAIIADSSYIDSESKAIVDQDEYNEMMQQLPRIVLESTKYIETYVDYIKGTKTLSKRRFEERYQFSTLPYFHDILGL